MRMTLQEAVIRVLEENEVDEKATTNTLTLENLLPEAESNSSQSSTKSLSKTSIPQSKKKGSTIASFSKTGSFKKTSI